MAENMRRRLWKADVFQVKPQHEIPLIGDPSASAPSDEPAAPLCGERTPGSRRSCILCGASQPKQPPEVPGHDADINQPGEPPNQKAQHSKTEMKDEEHVKTEPLPAAVGPVITRFFLESKAVTSRTSRFVPITPKAERPLAADAEASAPVAAVEVCPIPNP